MPTKIGSIIPVFIFLPITESPEVVFKVPSAPTVKSPSLVYKYSLPFCTTKKPLPFIAKSDESDVLLSPP